ncbi:hypothetical protein [Roseofilum casamattae]|uniref:Thylakoid lumen protein n=1 Tax=Roseofilum casamattae BLCC-M143 TaxID=3022442 RepID=A0ABT7BSS7_9CYAN|nr:hypothetical protein [Roseofilum casamattae]MDJ1182244.1 hypothetical protein [Roseofilum casamattae BLCC-M143]
MNSETLVQLLQQSFHVTLGATASLAEVLQDSQKREERWQKLTQDLSELTKEWSEKGKVAEQDARDFVDRMVKQNQNSNGSSDVYRSAEPPETPTADNSNPQAEIAELTAEIAHLRAELEKLRQGEN